MGEVLILMLGILTGFLASVAHDLFRYRFLSPKLVLGDVHPEDSDEFQIMSIPVENRGRGAAIAVQGFVSIADTTRRLMPVERLVSSLDLEVGASKFDVPTRETVFLGPGTTRDIVKEPLSWSDLTSRAEIDIYPGTRRILDVCRYVRIRDPQIQIPSSQAWRALLALLEPGNYQLTIHVAAQNARPASKSYSLKCDEDGIRLV